MQIKIDKSNNDSAKRTLDDLLQSIKDIKNSRETEWGKDQDKENNEW
jgi:hypothetical protein